MHCTQLHIAGGRLGNYGALLNNNEIGTEVFWWVMLGYMVMEFRTSPKLSILCWMERETLTQSIMESNGWCMHSAHTDQQQVCVGLQSDCNTATGCMRNCVCHAYRQSQNINKISPVWGRTVNSSQLTFVLTSKSSDTKTGPNIKNPAWANVDIVP